MKHIVKRAGHEQPYDSKKLYASIYAACLSVREPVGTAEIIASEVVASVEKWLEPKHLVTGNDLRRQATKYLKAINPNAAYLYERQRVLG